MEFVEPDDGQPFRRPPAPDDRVWRHPSELGPTMPPAVVGVGPGPEQPRLVPQRTVWMASFAAALGAGMITAGLMVVIGGLRERTVIEPQTIATVPEGFVARIEPAVAISERVRPSIVQINVQKGTDRGSGSGVVLRKDGQILTNAHVVEGATAVKIVLASGKELAATVVAADPITDVAVVKPSGSPAPTLLPMAEIGTAADLKVGQVAIAMGSPLGLAGGPSVTVGVISALHRSVRTRPPGGLTLFDMIQTDAPIAPGSSGGALLDGSGRIIGITTAIALTDAGAEGFGFATPIDLARSVADELIATGKATHTWMGIDGNDLDGATAHDLNVDGGAMVVTVRDAGPAADAGISARDVILSVDGRKVGSMGALAVEVRSHRPGDVVQVEVARDQERTMRRVTLAERPANP